MNEFEVTSERVARDVIERFPDKVIAWRESVPGAWGFLAGQAVLACRSQIGRSLTERERRAVWAAMWRTLSRERG